MRSLDRIFRARAFLQQKIKKLSDAVRKLFSNGEQGVWYDPSDLTTLFQDAAGTTPVTAVEQPVGLILDKSKGLVLGPELVTNGDFSQGTTGWIGTNASLSVVNGCLRLTGTGGTFARAQTSFSGLVVGRSYKFSVTCVSEGVGANAGFATGSGFSDATFRVMNQGQTLELIATATATAGSVVVYLTTYANGSGMTADYDNISVREVPGNHATQTTSTSRPVLSARVNLLTKTEQFDDAAWSVNSNVTFSAAKVIANTVNAEHRVGMSFISLATPYIHTYRVKPAGLNWCFIRTLSPVPTVDITYFDLQNCAVGTKPANVTAGISAVGDGSYDIYVVNPAGAYSNYSILGLTNANGVQSFAGNGVDGIEVYRADLRAANSGVNLPPYQRVNTATDYDTAGFPHYLRFDGVDDFLVTPTITPGTDKVQVFAGARKLNSAASVIAEFSASYSNSGAFGLFCEGTPGDANNYEFGSKGNILSKITASPFVAPITNVLTGIGDISGDSAILRVNGTQAASSTADQGTGNYLAYQLHIGRRGGTAFPFNGHLYSLIVRFGANLPTQAITETETWLNGKTKAYV